MQDFSFACQKQKTGLYSVYRICVFCPPNVSTCFDGKYVQNTKHLRKDASTHTYTTAQSRQIALVPIFSGLCSLS